MVAVGLWEVLCSRRVDGFSLVTCKAQAGCGSQSGWKFLLEAQFETTDSEKDLPLERMGSYMALTFHWGGRVQRRG